jgi:hypothetical protein
MQAMGDSEVALRTNLGRKAKDMEYDSNFRLTSEACHRLLAHLRVLEVVLHRTHDTGAFVPRQPSYDFNVVLVFTL